MKTDNKVANSIYMTASLVVVFAGMKMASNLVVPFLLALFISLISMPLLNFLREKKINTTISVSLVLTTIVILGLGIAAIIGSSLNSFRMSLPEYKERIYIVLENFVNFANKNDINIDMENILNYMDPGFVLPFIADTLSAFGNVLTNFFLIIFIVMFILLEASSFKSKLIKAFKKDSKYMKNIDIFSKNINKYIAIKTIISIITGLLVFIMLYAIGVDYAILWGVTAFFLNYIPNIGSIIASVPAIILSLIQFDAYYAILVAIGYLLINIIMGNIVEPRYLGKELGLSTLVVFISLIFWGWLLGPVGMILSIPLTMIIKIGLENYDDTKWLAIILSRKV
tara:strand:+ start:3953 stop:4972 length:1020 start_codon:yes stop_codon:yes gene_type:complete